MSDQKYIPDNHILGLAKVRYKCEKTRSSDERLNKDTNQVKQQKRKATSAVVQEHRNLKQ